MERVQREVRLLRNDELEAEATSELLHEYGYVVEIEPRISVD
jgi:hypothetical protein